MNKSLKFLSFIVAINMGILGQIHAKTWTLSSMIVSLDIPENWISKPGAGGVPLPILSPLENGQRDVIQIIPFPKRKEVISKKMVDAQYEAYKSDKLKELRENGDDFKSFYKVEEIQSPDTVLFRVGVTYTTPKGLLEEDVTYYTTCKGTVYYIKTYVPQLTKKKSQKMRSIIKSFRCEKNPWKF